MRVTRRFVTAGAACFFFFMVRHLAAQSSDEHKQARHKLVDEVLAPSGITNRRVLDAMRETLRHEFVQPQDARNAYFDMALPIGDKQTISSPFIVAYMTQSLDPQRDDRVLEIGTGSGYQAAVLSPLVREVYSIEIVAALGKQASSVLKRLNYKNVHTKIGDGFQGWADHAPFTKIIVTCSPEKVPEPLKEQLAEGGLMVIPVGERYQQTLVLMRKKDGKLIQETLRPTLFVPMTGRAEKEREIKPDPANPRVVNGLFEEDGSGLKFVPGWYYEQQVAWRTEADAPQGKHYITFTNETLGRGSHLLQGIPIDGTKVSRIQVSLSGKPTKVLTSGPRADGPGLIISFYDKNRKEIGAHNVGPFKGTKDWQELSDTIRVPPDAREGIVRLGLFGATGELSIDNVIIKPTPR